MGNVGNRATCESPSQNRSLRQVSPSQSHPSHTGHLRCFPLHKQRHRLYVSQIAFLCQSPDHASDYRNALAGSVPGVGQMLLRDCLAKVHQDIITCWNFRDEDKERRLCGVMRDTLTMFPVRS